MQTFFDSLIVLTSDTLQENKSNESNKWQNPVPPSDNPTKVAQPIHHTTKPSSISGYLSCLCTTKCFIPACLMCCFGMTESTHLPVPTQQHRPMKTSWYQHHLAHQHTYSVQHMPYHATLANMDAFWMAMGHVLPTQLDCPQDKPHSTCLPMELLLYLTQSAGKPPSHTQLMNGSSQSMTSANPTTNMLTPTLYSIGCPYYSAIVQSILCLAPGFASMHDLKPCKWLPTVNLWLAANNYWLP